MSEFDDSTITTERAVAPKIAPAFFPSTVGSLTLIRGGPAPEPGEAIVVSAFRNEEYLLPYFFAHYRKLGVHTFVLADNGSSDRSLEICNSQADLNIVLYHTEQSYREAESGIIWINSLLKVCARQERVWAIAVDIDELLVYPGSEHISVRSLIRYNENAGVESVFTPLLDLYANADLAHETDLRLEDTRYFDKSGYIVRRAARFPYFQLVGGPRHRAIKEDTFSLKKVALFSLATKARLAVGAHALTRKLELAKYSGALLHYKFAGDFSKKIIREKTEDRRTQVAHYQMYHEMLDQAVTFYSPGISEEYRDTRQLVEHGLMWTNQDYLNAFQDDLGGQWNSGLLAAKAKQQESPRKRSDLPYLDLVDLLSASSAEK